MSEVSQGCSPGESGREKGEGGGGGGFDQARQAERVVVFLWLRQG